MEARVKKAYPQKIVQSCAGVEFVKEEWRPVPPDREPEAKANPHLETRKRPVVRKPKPKVADEPADEPAVEVPDETARTDQ